LIVVVACTSPPAANRSDDTGTTVTTARALDAAPPPEAPVDSTSHPSPTQVTLKTLSSPSATVGPLTLTLLEVIEVSKPQDGKVHRFHRARLRVETATESQVVFLSGETTALGYTLTLHSARDGQADPHSPRETIAVIDVRPQ
jgi:hypothetical protein